ncbi:E4 [Gammapapillomavirus 12]|uniref:E4 n=2 Tax=Papillomaviridae TaxID=151340 RepID=A0A2D2ALN7_9PAPI|nr:E4 [Gammapapillomavirus 12]AYA94897.1 MAG: E4 protein [Human papillomavirus]
METVAHGLLNLKIKLFLPLLPATHVLFPGLLPRPGSPPRTPHPSRKALESDNVKPTKTPKVHRPHRPVGDFDYDAEKENQRPPQGDDEEEEEEQPDHCNLQSLLKKWERDLNRFRDKVLGDLEDYKLRLGIRT